MSNLFGQPRLPPGLLHDMEEIRAAAPTYDAANGGQFTPGAAQRITFKGCVLPVTEDDLRRAPVGTYTKESRKIYTNGHALGVGGQVYDPQDGATYTVTGDLDYGSIGAIRRFTAERKGVASPK